MKEKTKKQFSVMRLALMLFAFVFTSQVFAQREVTGTVKDANGDPLMSAQVRVPGTDVGTITDFDGNYTLTVPEGATSLEVVPIGVDPMTVNITGARVDVNFTRKSATDLDEVVVIGYGTTAKRDVVTSVASVSAEQLARRPVTSAVEAMQGQMAGVNVIAEDGSPDAQLSVRVRGGSSLTQAADPLYIVDGIQVSNINDISPSDIKSIDVLKDAASTAIYGAQGANGVVIITTKDVGNKGDKFTTNVDYTGFMGWKKQAKKWDMMSVEEFIRLRWEYGNLTDNVAKNFGQYFDPIRLDPNYTESNYNNGASNNLSTILDLWKDVPSNDWQDETFGRTGTNSNHSVTASLGNKNTNFRLSYNRIDDKGIMHNSDYTRNNLNLRANFKPIKNLNITLSGRYVDTEVLGAGTNADRTNDGSRTESRVRNAIAYTPITLLTDPEDDDMFAQEGGMFDPILTINDNYKLRNDTRYVASASASYKFLKNFTAKTTWSYDWMDRQDDRYYGPTSFWTRSGREGSVAGALLDADGLPIVGTGKPATVERNEENTSFQNTNTLEYRNKFGNGHNVGLLVGHEMLSRTSQWQTTSRIGYLGGDFGAEYTLDNANSLDVTYLLDDMVIRDPNDNMLSFFGRADYDYYGRYYFTATMRADATARFTEENRWGYFPSMAVAWRMSDESWFRDFARAAKISDLKWRFSYGVAGNNNVDLDVLYNNYYPRKVVQSMPIFDEDGTPIREENQVVTVNANNNTIIANPNLKWETTITRNLGLDYGFFRGRLSGAVDIYWNSTKDLIIRRKTGDKYRFENMGETEVKGFEFSTKAVILDNRAKEFNYSLTFDGNIGINNSKIVSLGGNSPYNSSTEFINAGYLSLSEFRFEEGLGLGRMWGYRYDGYYTTDDFNGYNPATNQWLLNGSAVGSPLAPALGTSGENPFSGARPGMMKLKDLNNDGKITAEGDMEQIGDAMPWAAGGFALSGSIGGEKWGTIDVNASFTYSIGNDVLNMTGLDLSTVNPGITSSAFLRNNLASMGYEKRYTLFNEDGSYIPNGYIQDVLNAEGLPTGEKIVDYAGLAEELTMKNASATTHNPIHSQMAITDNAVEDGSYLRFTALTIGYTLPNAWTKKAYLSRARIFFSASNLFLWTNYTGNDPDVNSAANRSPLNQGVDWSPYPKSRAFNFGVNLSF